MTQSGRSAPLTHGHLTGGVRPNLAHGTRHWYRRQQRGPPLCGTAGSGADDFGLAHLRFPLMVTAGAADGRTFGRRWWRRRSRRGTSGGRCQRAATIGLCHTRRQQLTGGRHHARHIVVQRNRGVSLPIRASITYTKSHACCSPQRNASSGGLIRPRHRSPEATTRPPTPSAPALSAHDKYSQLLISLDRATRRISVGLFHRPLCDVILGEDLGTG
jgi:hypothetical protein